MKTYNATGIALANGSCEVSLTPPNTYDWTVTHIAVNNTGTIKSTCQVFVDTRYFCGTAVGNGDTADGTSLIVPNGKFLRVVWASASPKAQCIVTIIVTENEVGS